MSEESSRDTAQQRAYRAFEALVAEDDAAIDLTIAALLVANIEYPDLDIEPYLAQLDALACRVRAILSVPCLSSELPQDIDRLSVIAALNTVLFDEEQFHGNAQDYFVASNSFLNKVLEDHSGIPITLSLLYMEVARRVGIQIDGIALPYHFVVRCVLPEGVVYLDAFERGKLLSEQDCRRLVRRIGKARFHPHWFQPVSHKQILVRMLYNLKHIYLYNEAFEHALAACDRLVLLVPDVAKEWHDRGLVHLQLKHYARALHDLAAYLDLAPDASDRFEIQNQIKSVRQQLSMMN